MLFVLATLLLPAMIVWVMLKVFKNSLIAHPTKRNLIIFAIICTVIYAVILLLIAQTGK